MYVCRVWGALSYTWWETCVVELSISIPCTRWWTPEKLKSIMTSNDAGATLARTSRRSLAAPSLKQTVLASGRSNSALYRNRYSSIQKSVLWKCCKNGVRSTEKWVFSVWHDWNDTTSVLLHFLSILWKFCCHVTLCRHLTLRWNRRVYNFA